jgi:hypothetical protein
MEIYYDPTDGVLMAQNPQGGWEVVKTNAQLDPQRIALDAKGFMYIAGLDGVAHVVKDFDENLEVRIQSEEIFNSMHRL